VRGIGLLASAVAVLALVPGFGNWSDAGGGGSSDLGGGMDFGGGDFGGGGGGDF